mmetsp:Transcript_4654/g.9089  ORF Transcript_4654/g.9089 Transcript_4654/m.9089 type:complete len:120 (-) Transcript_4654:143-502(-)
MKMMARQCQDIFHGTKKYHTSCIMFICLSFSYIWQHWFCSLQNAWCNHFLENKKWNFFLLPKFTQATYKTCYREKMRALYQSSIVKYNRVNKHWQYMIFSPFVCSSFDFGQKFLVDVQS